MTGSIGRGSDAGGLRGYYEHEAAMGSRRSMSALRQGLRADFIELLVREGRRSVLDAGAGPGLDGAGFAAAGLRFLGVDLAGGNGRRAAARGVTVVQGSVLALPLRAEAFDAAWSMSTLMHLSADQVGPAVGEVVAAIAPASPVLLGIWGRETEGVERDDVDDDPGRRRTFHLRSFGHNEELLAARAPVEWAERLDGLSDGWDYHVFRLRSPADPAA